MCVRYITQCLYYYKCYINGLLMNYVYNLLCFISLLKYVLFLIMVKNTKHEMYHLNHFKAYSSAVLTTCTWLGSRSPELFHLAKLKLCAHETTPNLSLLPAFGNYLPTFCFYEFD